LAGQPDRNAKRQFVELTASSFEYCYDNPLKFIDSTGESGIATVEQSAENSKKTPDIVTIKADYYYQGLDKTQTEELNNVIQEFNNSNFEFKDENGRWVEVKFKLQAIESKATDQYSKDDERDKDQVIEGYGSDNPTYSHFGNNLGVDIISAEEIKKAGIFDLDAVGVASSTDVSLVKKNIDAVMNLNNFFKKDEALRTIYRDVFRHEILHNLGGVHADGGIMDKLPVMTQGKSQLSNGNDILAGTSNIKDKTLKENKSNIELLVSRIGKPRTPNMVGFISKVNTLIPNSYLIPKN